MENPLELVESQWSQRWERIGEYRRRYPIEDYAYSRKTRKAYAWNMYKLLVHDLPEAVRQLQLPDGATP